MTTLPPDSEAVLQPNADAWDEEQTNLRQVKEDISRRLGELADIDPATAAYQETAEALQRQNDAERDQLQKAFNDPYVGRVDFVYTEQESDDDDLRQTAYVGLHSIDTTIAKTVVISFAAPAAALFYNPARTSIRRSNGELPVYGDSQADNHRPQRRNCTAHRGLQKSR